MKSAGAVVLAFALSGCIPPSAPPPQAAAPEPSADAPRIEAEPEVFTADQPVWDAQPVAANARTVEGGRYTVQPGDTLRSIGAKTGAGSETLARVNNLAPPYVLHPGDGLTVPGGRFHTVGVGETGIAIARAYGVPWSQIVADNALTEPYILRVDQRLLIPDEASAALPAPTMPSLEDRAAAFRLDIDDILTGGEPAVEAAATVRDPPPRLTSGFIWPAPGRITSSFGPKGEGQVNKGVEIAVAPASPIRAAADGTVIFVGNNVAPVGGLILIRHGSGWITAYGHIGGASVRRDQAVTRGQTIGKAGGGAPLLFFQMRKDGVPIDPVRQLPPRG